MRRWAPLVAVLLGAGSGACRTPVTQVRAAPSFELPVVLYTLGMLRIISSRWLYRHRFYWMVGLGLLANFMTPGADPLTPLLVLVPLLIFWEATALLLKLTGR